MITRVKALLPIAPFATYSYSLIAMRKNYIVQLTFSNLFVAIIKPTCQSEKLELFSLLIA